MAEAGWGVGAHRDALSGLLIELGALDDILDDFFLVSSLLVVAPPHGPLVFALEAEMLAGFTRWLALIALLPSQTACEASCRASVSLRVQAQYPCINAEGQPLPVRERRCIFAAAAFAALAALVVPTMVANCLVVDVGADEEDMDTLCARAQSCGI